MLPFNITSATSTTVPVIISVPHCGTLFPEELKDQFKPELMRSPDDTDWFVDRFHHDHVGLQPLGY
jgi:N-formylglutamate deformylase